MPTFHCHARALVLLALGLHWDPLVLALVPGGPLLAGLPHAPPGPRGRPLRLRWLHPHQRQVLRDVRLPRAAKAFAVLRARGPAFGRLGQLFAPDDAHHGRAEGGTSPGPPAAGGPHPVASRPGAHAPSAALGPRLRATSSQGSRGGQRPVGCRAWRPRERRPRRPGVHRQRRRAGSRQPAGRLPRGPRGPAGGAAGQRAAPAPAMALRGAQRLRAAGPGGRRGHVCPRRRWLRCRHRPERDVANRDGCGQRQRLAGVRGRRPPCRGSAPRRCGRQRRGWPVAGFGDPVGRKGLHGVPGGDQVRRECPPHAQVLARFPCGLPGGVGEDHAGGNDLPHVPAPSPRAEAGGWRDLDRFAGCLRQHHPRGEPRIRPGEDVRLGRQQRRGGAFRPGNCCPHPARPGLTDPGRQTLRTTIWTWLQSRQQCGNAAALARHLGGAGPGGTGDLRRCAGRGCPCAAGTPLAARVQLRRGGGGTAAPAPSRGARGRARGCAPGQPGPRGRRGGPPAASRRPLPGRSPASGLVARAPCRGQGRSLPGATCGRGAEARGAEVSGGRPSGQKSA
mmetsp:Transcript_115894/g.322692  ORF Transcript_115894/g.322692 Transcript_115894/m.322692 type:complete len:562 (-) Transcript_115894:49-1734(-)